MFKDDPQKFLKYFKEVQLKRKKILYKELEARQEREGKLRVELKKYSSFGSWFNPWAYPRYWNIKEKLEEVEEKLKKSEKELRTLEDKKEMLEKQ